MRIGTKTFFSLCFVTRTGTRFSHYDAKKPDEKVVKIASGSPSKNLSKLKCNAIQSHFVHFSGLSFNPNTHLAAALFIYTSFEVPMLD